MNPSTTRKSTCHSAKTKAYIEMMQQLHCQSRRRQSSQCVHSSASKIYTEETRETKEKDGDTGHSADEQLIFGYTVSKMNPLVAACFQDLLPQLDVVCSDLNVKVVHNADAISLEGDFEKLCVAKMLVKEMLRPPSVMPHDLVKSTEILPVKEMQEGHIVVDPTMEDVKEENQPCSKQAVDKIIELAIDVTISENTNDCDVVKITLTTPEIKEESCEIPENADPTDTSNRSVTQDSTGHKINSGVCLHCDEKFVNTVKMRKHMQDNPELILKVSEKRPMAPEGKLTEIVEQRTSKMKVMIDTHHIVWYQCTKCPMIGSRKLRMVAHYCASHLENGPVPFKVIEKPEEIASVADIVVASELGLENKDGDDAGELVVTVQPPKVSRFQRLDPKKPTVACEKCGYRTSAAAMRKHMRIKHAKHLYCCEVCDKRFDTLFLLQRHFQVHGNEKEAGPINPQKFACEKCGKKFSRKVDMVHHKQLGRSCCDGGPPDPTPYNPAYVDNTYRCGVCEYAAKQRVHVVQHHARRHAPKEFHCNQCTQTFAYERDLQNHTTVTHATEKSHKCEECGKCFASIKYLTMHKLRHEKVKKHFCTICNRGFLEKYRMLKHYETHKNKQERLDLHYCSLCGKGFSTDAYRKDHENIHTGLAPYSCKICGKTLKAAVHMWKHMQYYHGDKTHTCPHQTCKKRFKLKSGLNAHLVTHTRDRQHRCTQCGKVYTKRQTLLKHVCKALAVTAAANQLPETMTRDLCDPQPSIDVILGSPGVQQNVYICSECNEIFYEWEDVNQHMPIHMACAETSQEVTLETDNNTIQIHVLDLPNESVGEENREVTTAVLNMVETDGTDNADVNNLSITGLDGVQTDLDGVQQEELSSSQVWSMLVNPVDKEFTVDVSGDAGSPVVPIVFDSQSDVQVATTAEYEKPQTDIIQQALVE